MTLPRPSVATMDLQTLRRTRKLSVTIVVLLSLWLFGNLYEEVVTNVAVLAKPRPGSMVDEFAAGSPFYYYIPWGPLGLIGFVILRVRFTTEVRPAVRRIWNLALAALAVGLAVKLALIVAVNPGFRDPDRPIAAVHDSAVLWAFGNGLAVVATATALALLAVTRRPDD